MQLGTIIDHSGIALGALSGVLAARGRHIDLFGVLVLALVTALGGGTLRDLLAADAPVVWLTNPAYLYTVGITAIVGFIACRRWEPHGSIFHIADALALAFVSITGTQKALTLGFSLAPALVLGLISGVAGGMVRDVLTGRVPMVFQPDLYLYATAAFAGTLVYALLLPLVASAMALCAGVMVTVSLRLSALRYRIALPVLPATE
jgi:uncharacterized membrane protein YeiH